MAVVNQISLSAVTPTTGYGDNQSPAFHLGPGVVVLVNYTNVSATSLEVKLEIQPENVDASNWYSPTAPAGTDLSQILQVTSSGFYCVAPLDIVGLEVPPRALVRLSVKETGTAGGTVTVSVMD
ncbi:MAG: hypothetical protein ACPGVY_12205 [Mycobacterium sp.]